MLRLSKRFFSLLPFLILSACTQPETPTAPARPESAVAEAPAPTPAPEASVVPARPAAPVLDKRPVIVAFGDSLSAGYGADAGQSYPDYLQKLLDEKGYKYRVVNQGISGDTTMGGRVRYAAAIE